MNPDGTKKWDFMTEYYTGDISRIIADHDDNIYFSTNPYLLGLTPYGEEIWRTRISSTEGGAPSAPAIGTDKTIYVTSYFANCLYAIDSDDGSQKWVFHVSPGIELGSYPVVRSDGTIYVAGGHYNYEQARWEPDIYAIDPNGAEKWQFTDKQGWFIVDISVGNDGTIYAAGSCLIAINHTGIKKWSFTADDSVQSKPAIAKDGTIYIVTSGTPRTLYAIDQNGIEKWQIDLAPGCFPCVYECGPAIGKDGTTYIGAGESLYVLGQ